MIEGSTIRVPEDVLATLRPSPPYVMATAEDFARVQRLAATDAAVGAWVEAIRARVVQLLDEPVATYDIPDGKRLLEVSRRVVNRTYDLGLIWRLTREDRFRDRLWAEMEAVCAFPDWNPSHFLDTAEMAHAVAVAYDWLHEAWSDAQRQTMRDTLRSHAIDLALEKYAGGDVGHFRWDTHDNNWNVVCNGGISTAAVAIAADEPEVARAVLTAALPRMAHCLQHFAPDGGWPEGPGYWAYTIRYLVATMSTLEAALGSDLGVGDMPGLDRTAWFPLQLTGPSGITFNFSDAKAGGPLTLPLPRSQMHHYLAKRYGDRSWLQPGLWYEKADVMNVLFYQPAPEDAAPPPRDVRFAGVEAFALRSAWGDAEALYVAAQCGKNTVGHNQADLGTFVLDALGERWAIDPGPDDYNLPGYFGPERYDYYRNRAEGHNVIVVNPDRGAGQVVNAGGRITADDLQGASPGATMDLTAAYPAAERYTRRITMPERGAVVIEDELTLSDPGAVWWFWHTLAQVEVAEDGRAATLTQRGKRLRLTLAGDPGATFEVMDATPLPTSPDPEGQNPNNGAKLENVAMIDRVKIGETPRFGPADPAKAIRKLTIHLPQVKRLTLRITATPAPGSPGNPGSPEGPGSIGD